MHGVIGGGREIGPFSLADLVHPVPLAVFDPAHSFSGVTRVRSAELEETPVRPVLGTCRSGRADNGVIAVMLGLDGCGEASGDHGRRGAGRGWSPGVRPVDDTGQQAAGTVLDVLGSL